MASRSPYPPELDAALRAVRWKKQPSVVIDDVRDGTLADGLGPIQIAESTFWDKWRRAARGPVTPGGPAPEGMHPCKQRGFAMLMAERGESAEAIAERVGWTVEQAGEYARKYLEQLERQEALREAAREEMEKRYPNRRQLSSMEPTTERSQDPPGHPTARPQMFPGTTPEPGPSLKPYLIREKLTRALVNDDLAAVDALQRAERNRADGGRGDMLELIDRFSSLLRAVR